MLLLAASATTLSHVVTVETAAVASNYSKQLQEKIEDNYIYAKFNKWNIHLYRTISGFSKHQQKHAIRDFDMLYLGNWNSPRQNRRVIKFITKDIYKMFLRNLVCIRIKPYTYSSRQG